MTDVVTKTDEQTKTTDTQPEVATTTEVKEPEKPAAEPAEEKAGPKEAKAIHVEQTKEEAADALDTEQVVVFELAAEEYAAPILDVQEIIPTGDITPFPNMPDYIAGIINVRGTVATVINLASRFNLRREAKDAVDRYIILTNTGKALFGIMVDQVTSVMKIAKSNIKPATGIQENKIKADFVRGVAVQDERVILILDFQKILDEDALQDIAEKASTQEAS